MQYNITHQKPGFKKRGAIELPSLQALRHGGCDLALGSFLESRGRQFSHCNLAVVVVGEWGSPCKEACFFLIDSYRDIGFRCF